MKNIQIVILTLLFTALSIAQSGINYKAIIKDGSGNILSNQSVDLQFIIYEGAALSNNVYQESHTANTDANGIIIVNIGEGTTGDVFTDVAWGNDEHWLNVQVDTGAGLIDLGTTQFMAVPYALQAKSGAFATTSGLTSNTPGDLSGDHFVFGSSQLDDIAGSDDNSKLFFNKAKGAFRAGIVNSPNWNDVNIGVKSAAFGSETMATAEAAAAFGISTQATAVAATSLGFGTIASNDMALATGNETNASGFASFTGGEDTQALGDYSTAIGLTTSANGFSAVSMGANTIADATHSLAIGRYNEAGGNPTAWITTDALFEIGIGADDSNRNNALTVFKNGGITAPDLTIAEIDSYGNPSLVTKQYTDDTYAPKVQTISVVIPHADFVPASPANDFYLAEGRALFFAGNTKLIAPVVLPSGSTITSISAYIMDSSTDNYDFSLLSENLSSFGTTTIFTLTTNISIGVQILTYSTPIFIQNFLQYYVVIEPTTGDSWSNTGGAGAKGIRITYTN